MATTWFTHLMKMAKTDSVAKDIVAELKAAETEEQKEQAKERGKQYVQDLQNKIQADEEKVIEQPVEETIVVETPVDKSENVECGVVDNSIVEPKQEDSVKKEEIEDKSKFDLSAPAFNPRFAKIGITREEELFLKGVVVRNLTREERLQMRRSIYNKKKCYTTEIQTKFKAEQAEKREKALADPEVQKFHRQRKFVEKIKECIQGHYNFTWMTKNIDGLTVEVMRELLKNPGNVNAFNLYDPMFVPNFYKKYGE